MALARSRWLLPAAGVAALAAAALWLAADQGVEGPGAVPDLARGLAATLALMWLGGEALSRLLLPRALAPVRLAMVLPIGAMAAPLALTFMGFLKIPIEASTAIVLAGGAAASLHVRRKHGPVPIRSDRELLWWAAILALIVAISLLPSFRSGFATVPGDNPDAHLVTGTALYLQNAPGPTAIMPELPIDQIPPVWNSKYPIFYFAASVSELSGLDPINAFPAISGVLLALTALGFGLAAVSVLGLPLMGGALVAGVLGIDAMNMHLAEHPYYNQLWGLMTLPFGFLLGWHAIAGRHRGSALLLLGVLALAAFAYPLMAPYPAIFLIVLALKLKRMPALPHWSARRWTLTLLLLSPLLAVPLRAVAVKGIEATRILFDHDAVLWGGDKTTFLPLGEYVSTGGGWLPAVAVCLVAAVGLFKGTPQPTRSALIWLFALGAFAALRVRATTTGAYFDFKHLSFLAPIVLTLAVAGLWWLGRTRGRNGTAAAAAIVAAWFAAAVYQDRQEISVQPQVTPQMLEIREWSDRLPPGASVRLDIPPSGLQLWAGYMLAEHPLTTPDPVLNTTFPHAREGTKADFSIALRTRPRKRLSDPEIPYPKPPNAVDPPLFRNDQFVLRRLVGAPGRDTASQRFVQPG